MSSHFHPTLQALDNPAGRLHLAGINRGIEKESLRITPEGHLAQSPHPATLGSALTHSSITTDYSEALLEFITPVSNSIEETLATLAQVHSYVYQNLEDELLWTASMPCIVAGDDSIPVARYGTAHVARMKTVYRYGLGHRYGRLMQTIAGIHYNFSMPEEFWQQTWHNAGQPGTLQDYITERYLGLIRNFHRYSWLLIYLFGASPAVCASFLRGRSHRLQPFDTQANTLHLPYATALRMGNLGYNSAAQASLSVCYNSLDNYVETLRRAILEPHPDYRGIPHGEAGNYQQLNDSLLQIENEFYSTIRPKRVAHSGEAPLRALRRGGIEYIEVRCIDVSPFTPLGIDAQQIRFLDTFLLYCLLQDSPACDDDEKQRQNDNLEAVVNRGREPELQLHNASGALGLAEWADALLDAMGDVADLLEDVHPKGGYQDALAAQRAKVRDPELTPSARVLREMREGELPFFRLAMNYSERWAEYFRRAELSIEDRRRFDRQSRESLVAQAGMEQADQLSFEQYLEDFYAQYKAL